MNGVTDIKSTTAASWFAYEVASAAIEDAPDGRETALVERSAPKGSMAPLHVRDEAETYRIIEGRVTFFVDGDVVPAGPGDVVVAAAGMARTFRAESDGRWLVLTRVSSLARYVDFGRAVARPVPMSVAGWPAAEELATLSSIAAANGIELLGPPGTLPDGHKQHS